MNSCPFVGRAFMLNITLKKKWLETMIIHLFFVMLQGDILANLVDGRMVDGEDLCVCR